MLEHQITRLPARLEGLNAQWEGVGRRSTIALGTAIALAVTSCPGMARTSSPTKAGSSGPVCGRSTSARRGRPSSRASDGVDALINPRCRLRTGAIGFGAHPLADPDVVLSAGGDRGHLARRGRVAAGAPEPACGAEARRWMPADAGTVRSTTDRRSSAVVNQDGDTARPLVASDAPLVVQEGGVARRHGGAAALGRGQGEFGRQLAGLLKVRPSPHSSARSAPSRGLSTPESSG